MGEWARTSRGRDEDGSRRVDEKRWGWLPNSNLGVGRVGKWAQCGVTLRAFALSPSAPPAFAPPPVVRHHSSRVSSPTVRRHSTFRTLTPPCSIHGRKLLAKPSAKSHPTPRAPPPVPSKPDRPTLIDLLISTIVLYLPARTSFLLSSLDKKAILGVTNDLRVFSLHLRDFSSRSKLLSR